MYLSDEAFDRLVSEDVKGRVTPQQAELIRQPANRGRWRNALRGILDNVSAQMAQLDQREASLPEDVMNLGEAGQRLLAAGQTEIATQRDRIARFRFHVESRLDELAILDAHDTGSVGDSPSLADLYLAAIVEHRRLLLASEFEPTPIDEALWSAVDGRWGFGAVA
jgi:hypothetical protein